MLTVKSGLGEFANALDPQFDAPAEAVGAVRLLAALATKSEAARENLTALQEGAAYALRELGYENAAKDAENGAALAAFAPTAAVLELDDDDEDVTDAPVNEQIAGALDVMVETTKSLGAQMEQFGARLDAMENQTGASFGRGWDDSDELEPTMKARGGDLWSGSAFAQIQA